MAEREELTRLRRQVRQLQTERDIRAKATAWFAAHDAKTFTASSTSLCEPGQAPRPYDVPHVRRLAKRVLRMARSRAAEALDRRCGDD